jgi:hypothetical protein
MPTLADVFRLYGPAYLHKYGDDVPLAHRRVLQAIQDCRTGQLGHAVYLCDGCATQHCIPRSCGNRHCPTCQNHQARHWLAGQIDRLLPCPYFLITFTVPQPLRRFMRSHQRQAYAALFQAASQALQVLAADPKFLGTDRLGFLGVLHTWGRTLEYHPHVHFVVPAGGLSRDGTHWQSARTDFFLPVQALSLIYRAKFRDALKHARLADSIDPAVWNSPWVVNAQAVGDGRHSLRYLARYVFRVAISNSRILSCDHGQVVFRYQKSGSRCWRAMTLSATEFIRRFLQHVLPSGFMKVRHYGFLSARGKHSLEQVRQMIVRSSGGFATGSSSTESSSDMTHGATGSCPVSAAARAVTCPCCGHAMRLLYLTARSGRRIIVPPESLHRTIGPLAAGPMLNTG